jgi:TolC family type I secretion outer membrane protein
VPSAINDCRLDAGDWTATVSTENASNATPTAPATAQLKPESRARHAARVPSLDLISAVAKAHHEHPALQRRLAEWRGAKADQQSAESALYPKVQISAGAGGSTSGLWKPNIFGPGASNSSGRLDGGAVLRQLIFDFGAARAEIMRADEAVRAEQFRVLDEAEEISLKTAVSYLKILEQRQILALVATLLQDHQALAKLTVASNEAGNATTADMQRVESRVAEIRTIQTDAQTTLRNALDEFRRITALEPNHLQPPAERLPLLPPTVDASIAQARDTNPELLALRADIRSFEHQKTSVAAQNLPRVELLSDANLRNYHIHTERSELETTGMLVMRYNLIDGGLGRSLDARALADLEASRYRYVDAEEKSELRLRQAYQAQAAARQNYSSIKVGVKAAEDVKRLYLEQFKGGRRTMFEVLDAYMSYFALKRQEIQARYDTLRSRYEILRNVGRLTEAIWEQG